MRDANWSNADRASETTVTLAAAQGETASFCPVVSVEQVPAIGVLLGILCVLMLFFNKMGSWFCLYWIHISNRGLFKALW